jgi:hypothetical protein
VAARALKVELARSGAIGASIAWRRWPPKAVVVREATIAVLTPSATTFVDTARQRSITPRLLKKNIQHKFLVAQTSDTQVPVSVFDMAC